MTAGPSLRAELRTESLDGVAGRELVAALQAEYVTRYGGPDETPVTTAEFAPPDGRFLVGYIDGEPVACGGFRREPGSETAEIKRMYVRPDWRRRGLSRQLLAALEEALAAEGVRCVRLMTGGAQPEAAALYAATGYRRGEPYGRYRCAPDALFFEKDLG